MFWFGALITELSGDKRYLVWNLFGILGNVWLVVYCVATDRHTRQIWQTPGWEKVGTEDSTWNVGLMISKWTHLETQLEFLVIYSLTLLFSHWCLARFMNWSGPELVLQTIYLLPMCFFTLPASRRQIVNGQTVLGSVWSVTAATTASLFEKKQIKLQLREMSASSIISSFLARIPMEHKETKNSSNRLYMFC